MNTEAKIVDLNEAIQRVKKWQSDGEKVVFTNGCFDLVHLGHVDYLEKARNLGNKLVLGLNSDESIRRIKGPERPLVDIRSRSRVMAALEFVDLVVIFEEDTPLKLISNLLPDLLVKGNDYLAENIIGAEIVEKNGGKVETIPLVEGYSTTGIVKEIVKKVSGKRTEDEKKG